MMKYRHIVICLASAAILSCGKPVSPVVHTAPQVSFPGEEETVRASVGEKVSFAADILSGDRLTVGWYVNDVLEASTPRFEYVFPKAGNYTVRFTARNGAGEVSRTYKVEVADVFSVHLSIGDSTLIRRTQLKVLQLMAIVDSGSDVMHQWKVDGVVESNDAFFNNFVLEKVGSYQVSYYGSNSSGSYSKDFTVEVDEAVLLVKYSNNDLRISLPEGGLLEISAEAVYGGSGLKSTWKLDDTVIGTEAALSYKAGTVGDYTLSYHGENAKGETADRTWQLNVYSLGFMLDTFEGISSLGSWWTLGQNTPGITLADNPDKSGINTSDKVLYDYVNGDKSTSGYFTLKLPQVASEKGIDLSACNGIRFKVHLGKSNYFPRVEYGGVKYEPVSPPQRGNKWEVLEYRFPSNLDPAKSVTFRPLLQQNGSNIPDGAQSETNPHGVYLDDIEFLGSNL